MKTDLFGAINRGMPHLFSNAWRQKMLTMYQGWSPLQQTMTKIFLAVLVVLIVRRLYIIAATVFSARRTTKAVVARKYLLLTTQYRNNMVTGHWWSRYIVFQMENGKKRRFRVLADRYNRISAGDTGILEYKGYLIKSFTPVPAVAGASASAQSAAAYNASALSATVPEDDKVLRGEGNLAHAESGPKRNSENTKSTNNEWKILIGAAAVLSVLFIISLKWKDISNLISTNHIINGNAAEASEVAAEDAAQYDDLSGEQKSKSEEVKEGTPEALKSTEKNAGMNKDRDAEKAAEKTAEKTTEKTTGETTDKTPETIIYIVNAPSGLNLREEPSTTADKLTKIPDGTQCTGTGRLTEQNDWAEVEYNGLTGWASKEYLVEKNADQAPQEPDNLMNTSEGNMLAEGQRQFRELEDYMNSPEGQRQFRELEDYMNSPEGQRQFRELEDYMNSQEGQRQFQELEDYMNSPEGQRQFRELEDYMNSSEGQKMFQELEDMLQ